MWILTGWRSMSKTIWTIMRPSDNNISATHPRLSKPVLPMRISTNLADAPLDGLLRYNRSQGCKDLGNAVQQYCSRELPVTFAGKNPNWKCH